MSTDKRLGNIRLLDKLSEAFGQSEEQSSEEIRKEFLEEKFDIESAEAEMLEFRRQVSMAAKRQVLDEAKEQRENLELKRKNIADKIKSWSKEQVVDRFKEIFEVEPDIAVAYRNLEGKRTEDMKSILLDIELTRLMAENKENESE